MKKLNHIPPTVCATVLAHARAMRNARGDQSLEQWIHTRYRAAAALSKDLKQLHGVHAPHWAFLLIHRVAK